MKSRVHHATKAELEIEIQRLGLESGGTLDHLRRRLVEHIDANPRYIFPGTGAIEEKATPDPVATIEPDQTRPR